MKTITITCSDFQLLAVQRKAIAMSMWCKEHGLKYDVDYRWSIDSKTRVALFTFENDADATMFILRWS